MDCVPSAYCAMDEQELRQRIERRKRELGGRLRILGHHYQRQEIIDYADYRGDSFGLCRQATRDRECAFIVFCGVRFMAESADILAAPGQVVQHPDPEAGCPLASMADIHAVRAAWDAVESICGRGNVLPLTYMNSEAALKAFCGERGGAVCTSSNAGTAFRWALSQRRFVFFFPDENLGRNTARMVGLTADDLFVWDPSRPPEGGSACDALRRAKVILWPGFCHVHTHFRARHVLEARRKAPDASIVVHPECDEEVVRLSDACGSTEFICRFVEDAPSGSTIYVGTEINLVSRLARENPDKHVRELARSLCPNMYRIDLPKLLWTLEDLGGVNRVTVDLQVKEGARTALERMLALS